MADKAKRFFSLVVIDGVADLDIYGDIVSEAFSWYDSDTSAYKLSQQLEKLADVTQINVNINSYGGEVAEGIAIYNALMRHSAKVVTRCDGMACSIASVIYMAGDERIMYPSSMLMIHNASSFAWGTAAQLRKAAADNEKITSMSKAAYLEHVSITEERLTELMDAESWISPDEALEMGFATSIEVLESTNAPAQDARMAAFALIRSAVAARMAAADEDQDEDEPDELDDLTDEDETDNDEDETDNDEGTDDDPDPEDIDPDEDEGDKRDAQSFGAFILAAFN